MPTIVEKIFSNKLKRNIKAGEIIVCPIDLVMSLDNYTPIVINVFKKMGYKRINDPSKISIVFDHVYPPATIDQAQNQKIVLEFIKENGIKKFFAEGICHQVLPEKGLILPGDIIVGGDSHTCTYGALGALAFGMGSSDIALSWATGKNWFVVPETIKIIITGNPDREVLSKDVAMYLLKKIGMEKASGKILEFHGTVISKMTISDRMTVANMASEFGATSALFEADYKVRQWLKKRTNKKIKTIKADQTDKDYYKVFKFDISKIKPQIACPPSLKNIKNYSDCKKLLVNQVFIGTCANGRLEDLKIVYKILKNKKIYPGLKLIIIPASNEIFLKAIKLGYIKEFVKTGATICNPGCGPCVGRHQGVLAKGDVCVSTMNRNFIGRMGSAKAKIFLVNPEIAAKIALKGNIKI